jgi:hypothetical protein
MIVFSLVVDRKLKDCLSHALLVDIFELTQNLDQKVILVRAAMTYVYKDLPRLENLVY